MIKEMSKSQAIPEINFSDPSTMPIYALLIQMGKRVLRPGGMGLTRKMLEMLNINTTDEVVEFAPGTGDTAKIVLSYKPARYTAIERDQDLVKFVSSYLDGSNQQCLLGRAEETGLPDTSCSVVYGEAMMNMMPNDTKQLVIDESARILKPGGRYGFHEVYLKPDDIDDIKRDEIAQALRAASKVGVTPFTISEWMQALEKAGFEVREYHTAPFHLLSPGRVIQDEGFFGALRFVCKLISYPAARKRLLAMRSALKKYENYIGAVTFVSQKK
jgi:phospholipid N-methyltransferase